MRKNEDTLVAGFGCGMVVFVIVANLLLIAAIAIAAKWVIS